MLGVEAATRHPPEQHAAAVFKAARSACCMAPRCILQDEFGHPIPPTASSAGPITRRRAGTRRCATPCRAEYTLRHRLPCSRRLHETRASRRLIPRWKVPTPRRLQVARAEAGQDALIIVTLSGLGDKTWRNGGDGAF